MITFKLEVELLRVTNRFHTNSTKIYAILSENIFGKHWEHSSYIFAYVSSHAWDYEIIMRWENRWHQMIDRTCITLLDLLDPWHGDYVDLRCFQRSLGISTIQLCWDSGAVAVVSVTLNFWSLRTWSWTTRWVSLYSNVAMAAESAPRTDCC